jgi:hypothetical protein
MFQASAVVSQAVGSASRWLSGCQCHSELLRQTRDPAKRRKLLAAAGLKDGFCCWAGRRGPSLALGATDRLVNNVMEATSESYRSTVLSASEDIRIMVLKFEAHAKQRWCEIIRAKFGYWSELPYALVGLFGTYMGHDLNDCVALGRRIHQMWLGCTKKESMHRVAIEFFTSETLVGQLVAFNRGGAHLHHFPDMFCFVFRYAVLTVVGHYVEGRHRMISLHGSGAASHTIPGGHSALLRKDETEALCKLPDFQNFLAVHWRSKDALLKLLSAVCLEGCLTFYFDWLLLQMLSLRLRFSIASYGPPMVDRVREPNTNGYTLYPFHVLGFAKQVQRPGPLRISAFRGLSLPDSCSKKCYLQKHCRPEVALQACRVPNECIVYTAQMCNLSFTSSRHYKQHSGNGRSSRRNARPVKCEDCGWVVVKLYGPI